ncbi:uncharacterized protein RHO25_004970 [Cercospora beticola]|nr:hypothetical protein RHO25_004970 [Cercospora beticola]CAK1361444.1 unnamed protein product [Cercospora beticola]
MGVNDTSIFRTLRVKPYSAQSRARSATNPRGIPRLLHLKDFDSLINDRERQGRVISDNELIQFIQKRSLKDWAHAPRLVAGLRILRAGFSQNELNQLIKVYTIAPDADNLEPVQTAFKEKHRALMESSGIGESEILSRVLGFALDEIDAQFEMMMRSAKRQKVAATPSTTTLDNSDSEAIPDISSGWETPQGRLEETQETEVIPEPMRRKALTPNDRDLATTQESYTPLPDEADVNVNDSTTITHVDTEVKVGKDSPSEPGLETPGGNSGIDIPEQYVQCLCIDRPGDFGEDLTPWSEASIFSAETSELRYELLLQHTRWRTHSAHTEDAIY